MFFNMSFHSKPGLALKTFVVEHVFVNFGLVNPKTLSSLITSTAHVTNIWLAAFKTMAIVPLCGICHHSLAEIAVTTEIWCMFNVYVSGHGIT